MNRFEPELIEGEWYVRDNQTGNSYWDFFSCERDAQKECDELNNAKHLELVRKLRSTSSIVEIDKLLSEFADSIRNENES